jgi:hypothetical protein
MTRCIVCKTRDEGGRITARLSIGCYTSSDIEIILCIDCIEQIGQLDTEIERRALIRTARKFIKSLKELKYANR